MKRRRWWLALIGFILCLCLSSPGLAGGKGKDPVPVIQSQTVVTTSQAGLQKTPAGWSKGRKTSWQGQCAPPGLEKKGKVPAGLQKVK